MKRIWTLMLFLASTAVFLFACSSQAPESAAPTMPPTAPATAVPNEPTNSAPTSNDLNLIGQTGQPQFLNAYASW